MSKSVKAALLANGAIAVAKGLAAFFTGSASMMAEAVLEGKARRGEEAEPNIDELETAMTPEIDEELAAKIDEE